MKCPFASDSDVTYCTPAIFCVHFLDALNFLKQWISAKSRLVLAKVGWEGMVFCLPSHCE